ncbi:protein-disulfide isomerase [Pistricoccus aurantiacus]|uniref:Thiol:disulfide interchange protein n=1 Tax=Pistricoccus aurantiacus TaxID=1883414 RepID=A0A5B8SRU0_9GAMM|nr:thioredoxin fold domain-containing protein [Pistricoccus aurantiacus]QEA38974.1 protein-disulfide isomerase [Pistricoccus aurantiacus]
MKYDLSMIGGPVAMLFSALMFSATALAADDSPTASHPLAEKLVVNGQEMPVKRIQESPLEGLFEVRLESGETFYSDAQGKYFLVGDLFENAERGLVNLTDQARNEERVERLAQVPKGEQVTFRGVEPTKEVIHVFTDTTCPYCQKLHDEIPALNERGIEVRYLAFPRGGLGSQGARQLSQVWCAENPSEAMNAAYRDKNLESPADCDELVARQYQLGAALGVQGTPAIILPSGQLVPGYVPAERLAKMLETDS